MAERVCPWWVGYLLASPIRRLLQKPEEILGPYVRDGMTVLDVGCAMGFFTLPMADMVGSKGRVVAVDLQERMIRTLEKRARKAGVLSRIDTRVCSATGLGLEDLKGKVDFAVAFAMVHETPEPRVLFTQIHEALAPGGRLLVAEPSGHVAADAFEATVSLATECGLVEVDRPQIRRSMSVLLERPS